MLHPIETSAAGRLPDRLWRIGDLAAFLNLTEMIKTGGANVAPREVELAVQRRDGVQAAFVVVPYDEIPFLPSGKVSKARLLDLLGDPQRKPAVTPSAKGDEPGIHPESHSRGIGMLGSRAGVWRTFAAAVVTAMVATLALAGVASAADPPPARDVTGFCAGTGAPNPFTDVGPGAHHDTVLCLAAIGVTTGTTATTYDPLGTVRRDQMASFVARAIDAANRLEVDGADLADLPTDASDAFDDVAADNVHRTAIDRLAGAGVVSGVGEGRFDPAGPVTRAQMASFIDQAEAFLTGTPFSSTTDFFTDDAGDVHEASINGIAGDGIASGKAPDTYGPADPVTREQMASFIVRWLAGHHEAGRIGPAAPGGAGGPDLAGVEVTDTDGSGDLTEGDEIVLTYADPVAVSSSITITGDNGVTVTLTDDVPTPPGATPATFTLSADGTRLTVVPTGPVVFNGGDSLESPIDVTGASGIADAASGTTWQPTGEPIDEVRFEFEQEAEPGGGGGGPGPTVPPATDPIVAAVEPTAGPQAGGTEVTITGTRLSDATAVTFGSTPASSFEVVEGELVAVAPPGTGTVDVTVTTPGGTDTLEAAFTYAAAPIVSSVNPDVGPEAGGSTVTITGSHLALASAVTFGATPAASFTVDDDEHVTAVAPPGVGVVGVTVTTPGGTSLPALYQYVPAPTITSLTPASGPEDGGTTVTITGTDFDADTDVAFGGVPATSVTVDSATQVTAVTPEGTGAVDVVVTTPYGSDSLDDGFTYVAAPAITAVAPGAGVETGGETVTITGTGLTGATAVTFGDTPATSVTPVDDSTITAVTPAHMPGTVDVAVTTPGGSDTLEEAFTYVAETVVASVTPDEGPEAGGNTVTITGAGFTLADAVFFGTTPAASFVVESDSEITAVVPPGSGTVSIEVRSPGGSGTGGSYTYLAAPGIGSVTPSSGSTDGGTVVLIDGSGFADASAVTFGGVDAVNFTVVDDTLITAETPAGEAGAADVAVTSPTRGTGTLSGGFTYVAPPGITGVAPPSGPTAGGNTVTISGTGFAGATSVDFGGTFATITSASDEEIVVTAPAGEPGTVDVTVTGPVGSDTLEDAYTYVDAPTVGPVTPSSGPEEGGNSVTISGTGFDGASSVTFGGVEATTFTVDSGTQITATVPAGTAGTVDVVVIAPGGSGTAADAYTYVAAPVGGEVTPDAGPSVGGDTVTISGAGFTGASSVTFGGVEAASFTVDSDTQITAVTPAGTAGAVDVVVTTAGGSATLAGGYTYVDPPSSDEGTVEPSSGPETGGTEVTITGSGFSGATSVTFGGVEAATFTVDGDTQITAVTPAGTAGAVDVVVTTPGGTATFGGAFTYVGAPEGGTVTPGSGPLAGGDTVTITGSGFTGATAVTFGGIAAAGFTVVSDTEITATTPAGGPGAVDVVVTTIGGSATIADGYTYVAAPTFTSVSPVAGPEAGGNTVTITGSGFTGATAVTFGGIAATGFTVVSDTQITATAPAGEPGATDVVVTTVGGTVTATGAYTYVEAPTVSAVEPSSGPPPGGTMVTITGSRLTGATAVFFGATPALSFSVDGDGQIRALTPAGTGTVDVSVVTPGGLGQLPDAYSYVTAPVISSLTPSSGPVAGGNAVTITGTGFTGATSVFFGPTAAAGFAVDSDTQITATAPNRPAGAVSVVVITPGGLGSSPDPYTFAPVPTITSVSPDAGSESGGELVTITGSGFTDATQVRFGADVASFDVLNDTTITATAPAGSGVGDVGVVVTGPGGTSDPATYSYLPLPNVTAVNPDRGPQAGGNTVTITGTGLATATAVTFGGLLATFTVVDDTEISATAPAGSSPGAVDVSVTTGGGSSTATDGYEYLAPPTITEVAPDSGAPDGGNEVTITGSGLATVTDVLFGGVPAPTVTVMSDVELVVETPAGELGTVDVEVITAGGSATAVDAFEYTEAPVITSVDPLTAETFQSVEIFGVNLATVTEVFFGATSATILQTDSDGTRLLVEVPPGAGTVDIRVVSPAGEDTFTGFTYQAV